MFPSLFSPLTIRGVTIRNRIMSTGHETAMATKDGIGDGLTSPFYDGANDYTNVYSAGLAAAFNGAEGTVASWARVSAAGVWTDNANRQCVRYLVDANNCVIVRKGDLAVHNNRFALIYVAGGTAHTIEVAITSVAWWHWALTWSRTANEVRAYLSGTQTGATGIGVGVWVGALLSNRVVIGSALAGASPTEVWSGNLAHAALWNRALSPAEVAALAVLR